MGNIIKSFKSFNEGGTPLLGGGSPAFGDVKTRNKTLSHGDISVLHSEVGVPTFYTKDDFHQKYSEYLKMGGQPLTGESYPEFTEVNLDKILYFIIGDN